MSGGGEDEQVGTSSSDLVTVSQVFGEIVWLLTQSPRHSQYSVQDLGWLLMPPVMKRQFHLFRDGVRPVGAALWAYPGEGAERRLAAKALSASNPLDERDWSAGGPLWLVDLIAPFATADNRQIEVMLADLMTGPFKGKEFRMLRVDPAGGAGSVAVIPADAGRQLVNQMSSALQGPRS